MSSETDKKTLTRMRIAVSIAAPIGMEISEEPSAKPDRIATKTTEIRTFVEVSNLNVCIYKGQGREGM